MRDRYTREVIFIDILLSAKPAEIGAIQSLSWFCKKIYEIYNDKETARFSKNNTKKTRIAEMSVVDAGSSSATLLLHMNDRNGSDASFCDIDTDEHRVEEKGETEGRPETVHLLLKFAPEAGNKNRYQALLEVNAKINRAEVERYLNWMLRKVAKKHRDNFLYDSPSGNKKNKVRVNPVCEIQGHLSAEFERELAAGKLHGMKLLSREKKHLAVGETPLVKPEYAEVKLMLLDKSDRLAVFRDALRIGKNADYSAARIAFSSPDGVPHNVEVDTDTGNVRNDGFIKKNRIPSGNVVFKDAEMAINPLIESCMKTWLNVQ